MARRLLLVRRRTGAMAVTDHTNSESSHSRPWHVADLDFGELITALVPSLIGMAVVALIILAALW